MKAGKGYPVPARRLSYSALQDGVTDYRQRFLFPLDKFSNISIVIGQEFVVWLRDFLKL